MRSSPPNDIGRETPEGLGAANTGAAHTGAADAGAALEDLPPLRVEGRLDRLRASLAEAHVDAAVVADRLNVRWLTGFTGSNGTLIVDVNGDRPALLITDGRYTEQAPEQLAAAGCSDDVEVRVSPNAHEAAVRRLSSAARVGLETTVTWGTQRRWAEAVAAEITPLTDVVEEIRASKDAAELARIRVAARIADEALFETLPRLRPGVSEQSVQRSLDDAMRQRGAAGPAYDTIIASGPNAALPHALPTRRLLTEGDLVIVDVGAEVDGYRSDMTRTFTLGPPAPEAAVMIEVVTRSQAAGLDAVRPGVEASEIDRVCRSIIDEAGLGDAFVHATGHGVGLRIHELPRVSRGSAAVLQRGNVLTVEPGVYLPGVGGARVEDLVAVTEDGCRCLTRYPKGDQTRYSER